MKQTRNHGIRLAMTALSLCFASQAFAGPHDVFGVFMTDDGDSYVTIVDCGDGSPCGNVTWLDPESLDDGKTPETLQTKSGENVLGLQMLHSYERKKTMWKGGKIYSPQADKEYNSTLKRLDAGTLEVKGCIGPLCKTQIWTAVVEPE